LLTTLASVLELSAQETLLQLRHYQVVEQSNRLTRQLWPNRSWLALLAAPLLACFAASPAWCQFAPVIAVPPSAAPIPQVHIITQATPVILAQVPSPGVLPTDSTKGNFLQDQANFNPGLKFRFFQKLPARLWIQGQTEVNNRLDTNVFLNYKKPQPDYVFRIAPNLTVGYNIFNQTSVYAQYFMIKDDYTVHHRPLTEPVTQSIAGGVRHYIIPYQSRYQTYLDFQARELFQSKGLRQADLNPSINTSIYVGPHFGIFASALLQMRSQQLFLGPKREMDPFYTVGYWLRRGPWVFNVTDTLVTNYREPHFRYSIPKHGNVNMIADFELDRQIGNHPGIQLFVRAEPVFNWRSANAPGLSGFDFRLYGGLRVSFYKQSYLATMNQIKQQLKQQDGNDPNILKPKGKGKGKKKGKGSGDGKGSGNTTPGPASPPSPEKTTTPPPTSQAPDVAPLSPPAEANLPAPALCDAIARALGAIAAPAVGAIVVPGIGDTSPTAVNGKPSTAVSGKPSTAVTDKPSTAVTDKPSTVVSGKPSTAVTDKTPTAVTDKTSSALRGKTPAAVSDKRSPMAQKIDDLHKNIGGQKTALEPQA
jgi:hypothetical protein